MLHITIKENGHYTVIVGYVVHIALFVVIYWTTVWTYKYHT